MVCLFVCVSLCVMCVSIRWYVKKRKSQRAKVVKNGCDSSDVGEWVVGDGAIESAADAGAF